MSLGTRITIFCILTLRLLIDADHASGGEPRKESKHQTAPSTTSPKSPSVANPITGQQNREQGASEKTCLKLFEKFALPLQDLWKKRGTDLQVENTNGYALIEDIPIDFCKDPSNRQDFINLLSRILNFHSGKIGVILPLASQGYTQHILNGINARLRADNMDPKNILVVIDNQGKEDRTHQAIASLVFEHRVSAIIGGTESKDAAILRSWSSKLMIPTFIMSEPQGGPTSPYVFYSHPTQKNLATAAAEANLRFGHRRISILSPADQHSQRFVEEYVAAAKRLGIGVIHQVPYDSKRFELMEAAARKIFRLDPGERQEDLRKLYDTAKKHAQETGEPFNPKMIALQPDIQQDAVLIPDNFKIVRHFAKIFGYIGVRRMPLFGHIEWRSQGLVSPWDPFLNGSYFVDFQGSYASMPAQIAVATTDSPFLAAPDKTEQADFSLLGWRTIEIPRTLASKTNEMRRKLASSVPRKSNEKNTTVFDNENTIIWKPSLFTVTNKGPNAGTINLVPAD